MEHAQVDCEEQEDHGFGVAEQVEGVRKSEENQRKSWFEEQQRTPEFLLAH